MPTKMQDDRKMVAEQQRRARTMEGPKMDNRSKAWLEFGKTLAGLNKPKIDEPDPNIALRKQASWRSSYLDKLYTNEGPMGTNSSVEAKKPTRGYGITIIPEPLKPYAAREKDDRKVADAIVGYNVEQMKKDEELDFENLPDSMKMAASDVMYNTGTLFNNFRQALVDKDYPEALKQSLDIISAEDPDQDFEKKVVRGLINRRMDMYNTAAEDLGIPTIQDYSVLPSQKEGFMTNVTYNFGDGQQPIAFDIDKDMHTVSKTDARPQGYDVIKGSMQQKAPSPPKPPMTIFGTESLAYPGSNVEILGGLPSTSQNMDLLGR